MPDIISVIIALVLVIVAAVHDLREFRIPNRLIVAGIVRRECYCYKSFYR